MTLSKDGDPDIYIMDLTRRKLRRLVRHWAIDTEPSWSPDGRSIVFTSDRGGSPQIYRIPVSGGAATRVTYEKGLLFTGRQAAHLHHPSGQPVPHRGNGPEAGVDDGADRRSPG